MAEHIAMSMSGILFTGGLVGYVKGKSVASLIAGSIFGAVYGLSAMEIKKANVRGFDLALGTSIVLLSAMTPKLLKKPEANSTKRKYVPATLCTLALVTSGYYAKKSYEFRYGV